MPMKRSASCGAVTVDEDHQPAMSRQLSAVKQETVSATDADAGTSDPRYTNMRYVNRLFGISLLVCYVHHYAII